MGRRCALLLSAVLLLATGGCAPSHHRSPASVAPPPGDRWAGEGRVVVAVPGDWRTVEDPLCGPPPSRTVVYPDPNVRAYGCTNPGPRHPPSYLAIYRDYTVSPSLRSTAHPIEVDGLRGYAWNHARRGDVGLAFPSEHLLFSISTPDPRLGRRILHSASAVPPGYVTIPPIGDGSRPSVGMIERLHEAGLRPTYVEERWPGSAYPGMFLRTDPPVGAVVSEGRSVTALYSSGNLSSWITAERLARRGWQVSRPRSFAPLITRNHALAILGFRPDRRPAFLRTVTVDGRSSQAWVIVQHPQVPHAGWAVRLAIVDAMSGRTVCKHVLFPHVAGQ